MPKIQEDEVQTTPPNPTPDPKPAAKGGKGGKPPAKPKKAEEAPRPVIFPEYKVELAVGDKALTAEAAKKILGWKEVDSGDPCVSELTPIFGKRIQLTNNGNNRFLTPQWLKTLCQEHLNKRWRFNGETICIGKTGSVLSGQHRLLSLIMAEYERTGKQAMHWEGIWDGPVTMETLIVKGVSEDDDTFKTLNCGKPGTFAEFLFRSDYLKKTKASERKPVARMVDHAVRLLWLRTGENLDAFAPKRTHGEAENFLKRHPKVLKAVDHIFAENQTGKDEDGKALPPSIGRYVSPGYAAGALYLMATSDTDPDANYFHSERTEAQVDLGQLDKAEEFWIVLSQGAHGDFRGVVNAIGALADPETGTGGNLTEKLVVIAKAWAEFKAGRVPKEADVGLGEDAYAEDDDGNKQLVDLTGFGGIDVGPKFKKPKATDDGPAAGEGKGEGEEGGDDKPADKPKPKTAAERKKARDEKARKLMEMKNAKARGNKDAPPASKNPILAQLEELRKKAPGHLLLSKGSTGTSISAWGDDAAVLIEVLKLKDEKHPDGIKRISFPAKDLEAHAQKLMNAGHKIAIAEERKTGPQPTDKETVVSTPYSPPPRKGAAEETPAGKATTPAKKGAPAKK